MQDSLAVVHLHFAMIDGLSLLRLSGMSVPFISCLCTLSHRCQSAPACHVQIQPVPWMSSDHLSLMAHAALVKLVSTATGKDCAQWRFATAQNCVGAPVAHELRHPAEHRDRPYCTAFQLLGDACNACQSFATAQLHVCQAHLLHHTLQIACSGYAGKWDLCR